jgi:glyoxylase-like metal-dependent hydrolase (beta-lactamase superfamily II)/rhodanese-related sulfurtransferase
MYLQRFYLDCLSHASYLVADERTKLAAVIDPQRDVGIYLDEAREHGFAIKYVILTHFHADFVAGHIELRDQAGATIALGAKGGAQFEHRALRDGDVIDLGGVRLKTLETPGHTPEGITLLAYEAGTPDDQPYAAFTGDTLFIGDVGRPDLLASIGVTAQQLGEMLYDSLHQKILPLPDATLVYPAHGAGSMCGKQLSSAAVSTIGDQRQYNYALQPMSKQAFLDLVTEEQPTAPQYFVYDAITNRQERESLERTMQKSLRPLSVNDVQKLQREKAQVVDVRDAIDFEGGHLKGALNVGLRGKYATWAGSVLNHDDPIVVIAEEGNEEEAVLRLGRIGYDNVAGFLGGGMNALQSRSELLQTVERVTAPALQELMQQSSPPLVIDVRTEKERKASGYVPGSVNIPLAELRGRLKEVPANRLVAVHCEGGYRSAIAASLLQQSSRHVLDIVGGFKAWAASKLPVDMGA